ncbi:hypothetical protein E7X38_23965, partial [Streptomyces sp. Akac8]
MDAGPPPAASPLGHQARNLLRSPASGPAREALALTRPGLPGRHITPSGVRRTAGRRAGGGRRTALFGSRSTRRLPMSAEPSSVPTTSSSAPRYGVWLVGARG